MSDSGNTASAAGVREAATQAENLLAQAFAHLKECVAETPDRPYGVFFPSGVDRIEIRVNVQLSEYVSVTVDMDVAGKEGPVAEPLDLDDYADDPLLYDDVDEEEI